MATTCSQSIEEPEKRVWRAVAAGFAVQRLRPGERSYADLELKRRTLDRITPPTGHPGRYRAPDSIIAFLDDL